MAKTELYNSLMNSREWRELRKRKLRENPLCEFCEKEGIRKKATCIHHIEEVENGSTVEECRNLCFNFDNLVSLCTYHHYKLHNGKGYNKAEARKERERKRQERWGNNILRIFTENKEI